MTSDELEAAFASRGIRHGRIVLFEDRWALALIDKAQQEGVAVAGVDLFRAGREEAYTSLRGHAVTRNAERAESWRQARDLVNGFSGRGLLFEVVLESPTSARLIRWRDRMVDFRTWSSVFTWTLLSFILVLLVIMTRLGWLLP